MKCTRFVLLGFSGIVNCENDRLDQAKSTRVVGPWKIAENLSGQTAVNFTLQRPFVFHIKLM